MKHLASFQHLLNMSKGFTLAYVLSSVRMVEVQQGLILNINIDTFNFSFFYETVVLIKLCS